MLRDREIHFPSLDGSSLSVPPVSYRRKEFPDGCSEYKCDRVFRRDDDVMKECSKLLRHDCESQWDQDRSRRIKRARMSVPLNSAEEVFLCGAVHLAQKYRVKFP